MSNKPAKSGLNSGIMSHGGRGNVQYAGKTDYGQSKWKVSTTKEDDNQPEPGRNENAGENTGIMSIGEKCTVQAAGDTKYALSDWTLEIKRTEEEDKNTKVKK